MSENRWQVIPRTRGWSVLFLIIGLALIGSNGYQVWTDGHAAVFQIIALAAALALVVASVIGLVSPRSRGAGDLDRNH
jgi:hypothetical protein